ncbi:MAG: 23S rRNA pseudouridine(1911/1915/1917) synthase RluD [Pseudomonadaceae bacterium]|nr:23S rRNA pseudouridine(1911/1915/1917) synthase RluD [Pseudomonadaceae bacterium]
MDSISEDKVVPAEQAGERIDKAAAHLFADFSRAELARWITSGELTVDGKTVKPREKLRGGEHLTLRAQRVAREAWQEAQPIELDILYEDEHLLVINKPAGLVVHPGAGNPSGTLVNGLLNHRDAFSRLSRAGVVHRLDKDTSGVMVIAADELTQLRLSRLIEQRKISREYECVAEGRMVAGVDVDRPIGRDPHVRTRQAIVEEGKPAQTKFRVLQRYRAHTLVHARLQTGRTHQIRVHMQSIGYPLVGDRRYGARGKLPPGCEPELIQLVQSFPRQALHAKRIAFAHPITEAEVVVEAPWPADFAGLVAGLQADLG